MFNNWHKKEKPIQGMMGMGGGATGYLVGGAGGGAGLQVQRYDVQGSLIETIDLNASELEAGYGFDHIGYYKLTWSGDANVRCWVWGGAGGRGNSPGPSFGGAGGGARGEIAAIDGAVWTVIVGGGGKGPGSVYPGDNYVSGNKAFPDGGACTYNAASGGGSSRIAITEIPYANRDTTSNVYHLIGGGGGGGIGYTEYGGTIDGRGGGTDGQPGGGYYPSDGSVYGRGASQSGGGSRGPAGRRPAGSDGSKFNGGNSGGTGGGGGGGGYYGGGGAGGYYGTGGGGSGYIHPSVTNNSFFVGPSSNRQLPLDDSTYPQPVIANQQRATGSNYARPSSEPNYLYTNSNNRGYVKIQVV
tara:strand:- start:572 stop:1639 length:1068 start_codon:yes stop_codon:yes gene_type:complete